MMDEMGEGRLIHQKIEDALQNIQVNDDLPTKVNQ